MNDFEMWIYRGAITILLAILWYMGKRLLAELKEIKAAIQGLSENGIRYEGLIQLIRSQMTQHNKRIDDHAGRLRELERKYDQCKNYQE